MNPWFKALVCLLFLSVMFVFANHQTNAPTARQDSDIDYLQLAKHVEVMAARPHPMGSAANHEVRDYIVRYFESLGLTTEIQKATVVYHHPSNATNSPLVGYVENIIARLPGTASPSADGKNDLVLMAHYDSRENAPGAGDDLSGTASVLETARVLSAQAPPVHDVIFLITDGEEMGLLGAQAFFRQHTMAEHVGLVLNFEARGSSGESVLFETSENNSWLVDHVIKAIPDLSGDSLTYEVYKIMPNDTDLSISKGEGIPGLNFAFAKGLFDYHAITDSSANLDPDTLAQQANNALFATRYFANLTVWEQVTGDKTFFQTGIAGMASYSQTSAVILGVVVLLSGFVLFVMTLRGGQIQLRSIGKGMMALLAVFIFSHGIFQAVVGFQADSGSDFYPHSDGLSWLVALGNWPLLAYCLITLGGLLWLDHALNRGLKYSEVVAAPLLIALIGLASGTWQVPALLVVVVVPLLAILRSGSIRADMWVASLVLWWLLALLVLVAAPNASYLLMWPLLSILLGIALIRFRQLSVAGTSWLVTLLVASIVPLLLFTPFVITLYILVGQAAPQAMMGVVALIVLLGWPLFRLLGTNNEGKAGVVLLLLGIVPTVVFMTYQHFDARHPRGEELFFAVDVDEQKSYWGSRGFDDEAWLGEFFGPEAPQVKWEQIVPGFDGEFITRATTLSELMPARVSVKRDFEANGKREINMHLESPSNAGYINVLFSTEPQILSLSVNGFSVDVPTEMSDSGWWRLRWYGLPENGGEIALTTHAGGPIKLRIVEVDRELPPDAPRRPIDSMPELYSFSESTLIFQTIIID